jgi:hypothetical protein
MLTLKFKLVGIRDRQWWVIKYDEIIDGKTQDLSNPNKVNILLSKDYEDPIKLEWANPGLRESLEPPTLHLDTNIMKSKEDFIHSIKNILCNINCKYIPDKYDDVEFKYLDKMYEKVTRGFWKKEIIEKHNEFGKNSLEDLDTLMNPHKGYGITTITNRDGKSPKILCEIPNTRLVIFKDPLFLNTDVKRKDIQGIKVGFILGFIDSVSPEINLNYMDVTPLIIIEMDIYKKYNYYTSSHIDNIHSTMRLNRDFKATLKHHLVKALNEKTIEINFTTNQKDFWVMNHSIDFGRGSKKVSILCEKANFSNPHKFRFTIQRPGFDSKEFILDPKNNKGTEKYPNTLSEFFSYICSIIEYNEDYTTFLDYFRAFLESYYSYDLPLDIAKHISKFYPVSRGGNITLNNGYMLDKFKFVK